MFCRQRFHAGEETEALRVTRQRAACASMMRWHARDGRLARIRQPRRQALRVGEGRGGVRQVVQMSGAARLSARNRARMSRRWRRGRTHDKSVRMLCASQQAAARVAFDMPIHTTPSSCPAACPPIEVRKSKSYSSVCVMMMIYIHSRKQKVWPPPSSCPVRDPREREERRTINTPSAGKSSSSAAKSSKVQQEGRW